MACIAIPTPMLSFCSSSPAPLGCVLSLFAARIEDVKRERETESRRRRPLRHAGGGILQPHTSLVLRSRTGGGVFPLPPWALSVCQVQYLLDMASPAAAIRWRGGLSFFHRILCCSLCTFMFRLPFRSTMHQTGQCIVFQSQLPHSLAAD